MNFCGDVSHKRDLTQTVKILHTHLPNWILIIYFWVGFSTLLTFHFLISSWVILLK